MVILGDPNRNVWIVPEDSNEAVVSSGQRQCGLPQQNGGEVEPDVKTLVRHFVEPGCAASLLEQETGNAAVLRL